MLAKQWLTNARGIMSKIEDTQMENIRKAAEVMADSIGSGRWVHTFGCGHATLPIEEMYPRIGGFVGFHPIVELPLTFFTNITGGMGVHQFIFLERVEGYGVEIMKGYDFDKNDVMWLFSHTGINNVNIDIALEAKKKGMKVVVFGSAAEAKGKKTRHSSQKNIFEIADIVVDTCAPIEDASVPLKNHVDKIGPVSTMAFIATIDSNMGMSIAWPRPLRERSYSAALTAQAVIRPTVLSTIPDFTYVGSSSAWIAAMPLPP